MLGRKCPVQIHLAYRLQSVISRFENQYIMYTPIDSVTHIDSITPTDSITKINKHLGNILG